MAVSEEASEGLTSTRVFVKGLPPTFTSQDLRKHFGHKFPVTDAHVLSDRRIAFVGLNSSADAQNAAKYFDRSFVRMSKISVELARPVDVQNGRPERSGPNSKPYPKTQYQAKKMSAPTPLEKRKRELEDEGEELRQTNTLQSNAESVSKSLHSGKRSESDSPEGSKKDEETTVPVKSTAETEPLLSTSDNDWLRAKTNRILDLQDPDEAGQIPSTADTEKQDVGSQPSPSPTVSNVKVSGGDQSENVDQNETQSGNGRLFIRNLAFDATEDVLKSTFSNYGRLSEVHVVKDKRSGQSKGLAFLEFVDPVNAGVALKAMDGQPFQGRLLHVLPALDKNSNHMTDFEISKLPLKKQKAIKRKTEATNATFSWNSLYMNPDAVLESTAKRLGVDKSDLLDVSSTDAAVKQAHAETNVIKETKAYLSANGVNIEALKNQKRDDRTILLKNFPFGTSADELSSLLAKHGTVDKVVFPPTGTMAIALFRESHECQSAMQSLAYSNIRGSVLYLEKAPEGLFAHSKDSQHGEVELTPSAGEQSLEKNPVANAGAGATVFVRNLNFATTNSRLQEVFKPLSGFLSARIKTRIDPGRPGQILSMGFGFVEFRTKAQAEAAVATLDGHRIDGHELSIQMSQKVVDAAEQQRVMDKSSKLDQARTKIIIKNLPFEASKKDVRALFAAYGKLRSLRMPKKFDHSARGFAFADFISAKEAKNACEALSHTHLLGRRLVLDFAEGESEDPEEIIKAMEKKADKQVHLTTFNKMIAGSARRKFNVDAGMEGE